MVGGGKCGEVWLGAVDSGWIVRVERTSMYFIWTSLFAFLLATYKPEEQGLLFDNQSLLWESLMLQHLIHPQCSHAHELTRLLQPPMSFPDSCAHGLDVQDEQLVVLHEKSGSH